MKTNIICGVLIIIVLIFVGIEISIKNNLLIKVAHNLYQTSEIKQMNIDYKVNIKTTKSLIIITLSKAEIKKKYEIEYKDSIFKITVEDVIDQQIYIALLNAIFKNYGYDYGQATYLQSASDYILKKAGITKTIDEEKVIYNIEVSKNNKLAKNLSYVTKELLEEDYLQFMNCEKVFSTRQGDITLIKSYGLYQKSDNSYLMADYYYILEDSISSNTLNTVKEILSLLMSEKEFEQFEKNYLKLENIKNNQYEIIVDYSLAENELSNIETKVTKVIFSHSK